MGHCGGGEGPNVFVKVGALGRWVEQVKAPDTLIASHSTGGKVDRTGSAVPLSPGCQYTGTGSIDAAENFVCRVP